MLIYPTLFIYLGRIFTQIFNDSSYNTSSENNAPTSLITVKYIFLLYNFYCDGENPAAVLRYSNINVIWTTLYV